MKHLLRTTYQLGQLLQSARKRAGWSQTELAVRINLSQSRLSKLEQNPGSMTVDQLLALCGSLGLDLTLQVRGTDEPAATPAEW
ncbi:HTH-type transcriptional regulator/antitoxin HipB [Sphaerotilus sulfidivorans]|jgi:HTH-type transcriptional regulator/antitoxin HipB|uniref:HTH-type transcriptional regulator/antitoxin HipB n=1 Tax=Sphaerotilus sulfidivorans TaxID=639200 RepID=A0A5C1Q6J9_9BURK|nr:MULTISPECIES: helix-turn-helix transcriptional regulator [Sphaerotilus]GIX53094.1 hypothetical protein CQA4T8M7_23500 [Sphaerotilus natans]MCK6402343.1 helix-turn-helix domain-containing protein [Sphaerotilus sulfidivorans]NZD47159.1 helix-turn-helix transcriptional regulator [Sphaerotilus sulfidivorans]QEN02466.1 XRE family transcriptional regulator [Sphaerotilus sulfidivorans]GKQ58489.1 hypothetical protein QMTAC487_23490 [Sphaerotilus sp. FB-3]